MLPQVDLFESAGVSLDRIDMVVTNVVPRLRRAGVDDATLRTILIGNPRRVLSFVPRD